MEIVKKDSDKGKQLKKITKLENEIRGSYLNQSIHIEGLIGDIISRYFCIEEKRRKLLFSIVITESNLSFHKKVEILKKIIELQYPDMKVAYPTLIDTLEQKIIPFRNRLAHSMLDNSEDFLAKNYPDRIRLTFYKQGLAKSQDITTSDIEKRLGIGFEVVTQLMEIQQLVIERTTKFEQ